MPNLIDLTNQRFGRLVVKSRAPNKGKNVMWHCQCDCGIEKDIQGSLLRNGHTQSCGCLHNELLSKRSQKDLTGMRSGRLVALEPTEQRNKDQKVIWKCQCDCGNIVYVASSQISCQQVKSCGCLDKENRIKFSQLNLKDISGQRFGKLVALRRIADSKNSNGGSLWECQCDCGNIIQTRIHNLTDGSTQSCGCLQSHGEQRIIEILQQNNIYFEKQKSFSTCINPKTNKLLFFDFYLPKYNLLVEYDGEQHFYSNNRGWNTNQNVEEIQYRDNIKNNWCQKNNIKLIRISYTQYKNLNLDLILGKD